MFLQFVRKWFVQDEKKCIKHLKIKSIKRKACKNAYSSSYFFFLLSYSISHGNTPTTDTLSVDSLESRPAFFKRMYKNVYRYFTEANQEKETKRFDFSVIGGPHFFERHQIGTRSGSFGTVPGRPGASDPSAFQHFFLRGRNYHRFLSVRHPGTTIFKEDKYRLGINFYFFSFPSKYWGIGYTNGNQKDHYTTYKRLEKQIRVDFSRRLFPNTYLGVTGLFRHVNGKDFKDPGFLDGEKANIATQGFGLFLTYDSRDFLPNPYRGTYARIDQLFFPDFWGNKFKRTEVFFRQYNKLWKGAILASDLQGDIQLRQYPLSMVALLGGSYQMRGYYEGQYRDNDLIQTQVELRQHIYNRHGIALWGGAGNVFPKFKYFKWKETLPTYGIGYRWEFKKRVNVRLDYGFGKGQSAFYFNIDEAFFKQ